MSTTRLPYRLGDPDIECHYPVIVWPDKTDLVLGRIFRFHRPWYGVPNGKKEHCVGRPHTANRPAPTATPAAYPRTRYAS
ncbi:hypothetical protein ACIQC7_34735 [Kitasatospora sp. NPDC088556]|uniref:hypothetical protein n=1 Tax=Kitasatospora sp. NPDC088556 TaxID=3364076 RepID=UPI00381BC7DD